MCEFCKDKNGIENEIETNTGHWFLLKSYGKYALYYRHGDCANACGIPVNNCPMCGRNLTEE